MEPSPNSPNDRKSASGDGHVGLFKSIEEKVELEARNGLLQFDRVNQLIDESNFVLSISPTIVAELQDLAIRDIYPCAGTFRDGPIWIANSPHTPPPASEVPRYVEHMCEYANSFSDHDENPLHVAAYLMWRHNWIHPFFGGNGRTSRALSYLALCVHFKTKLPGRVTIPEQIVANRQPYYEALDAADAAWLTGIVDVSAMESLMFQLLKAQLDS